VISLLLTATLGQFLGPTGGVDASPFGKKKTSLVFSFTAPSAGSYASLTPTVGGAISCTRASTGTYLDGTGTRQTAAANTCRVENAGLLVEGPSTNNLLNSGAPVTQTTASLATGSYTGWVEGTGSLAFTVGTAVATGLPCTATTGVANDCHFTITGAGTIVATVTGSLTLEDLEPLAFRSSYIATAGTAASRSADAVSATIPATGPYFSMSATAVQGPAAATAPARMVIVLGSGAYGAANTVATYFTPGLHLDAFDGAAASRVTAAGMSYSGTSHKFQFSANPVLGVNIDGSAMPGFTQSGTGNGVGSVTTVQLGGQTGANYLYGNVSAACVAKTSTGCAP